MPKALKPNGLHPDEMTSQPPSWAMVSTYEGYARVPMWFAREQCIARGATIITRDVVRQLNASGEAARDAAKFISKFLTRR